MVSNKKKEQVESLQKIIEQSPHFALIGFGSVGHQNLEELRNNLRKLSSKLQVVKNTLLSKSLSKLAIQDKKYDIARKESSTLKDKTAFLSLDNEYAESLKTILDFSKTNEDITFKFGLLDGQLYDSSQLLKIAALPSKNQLISKLIYTLKSPSSRLYFTLKSPMSRIINVLKSEQLSSTQPQGGEINNG